MEIDQNLSLRLIAPFTMVVAGSMMSGKTELVKRLMQKAQDLISPRPTRFIISYTEIQPAYSDILDSVSNVTLINGLDFTLDDFDGSEYVVLIVDDQMQDTVKSSKIQELFTKGVHHKLISVILLQQNLFPQGKHGRDIRLNSNYIVIMKSPTFPLQVACLGRQLFPHKPRFLSDAYKKATVTPYSYLFINLHPLCEDQLRVSEGFIEKQDLVIYTPE